MKALWIVATLILVAGCSKKQQTAQATPEPSPARTVDDLREDLISFSKGMAHMDERAIRDSMVHEQSVPEVPSPSLAQAPREISFKRKTTSVKGHQKAPVDSSLSGDSLSLRRPFTKEEIEQYVLSKYRTASSHLATRDPAFHQIVEEGQAYSKDGAFSLLKAEWALNHGKPEYALVQAELALRAPIMLEKDGSKKASLIRCKALDVIKTSKPSERADAAASQAWLSYNLTFSP